VQFGPDGCLYVVDWYNPIISHNEVPRNHPDRDRVRGRIWRIRHASQAVQEPVAVANAATDALPALLGAGNARIADFAWQEIVDRDAKPLVPRLESLVTDASAPVPARAGGLWALEGLGAATPALLEKLVGDGDPGLRHEAIRIAGTTCSEAEFRRLAAPLVDDPSPRVRAALGDALRRIPVTEAATVAVIMKLGRKRETGDEWTVYDRDFERFLARWALERHAGLVADFLDSPAGRALPVENRLLATLVRDPETAATAIAGMIPLIGRPLDEEEIRVLAAEPDIPVVATALERLALDPKTRSATLRALLRLRTGLGKTNIGPLVSRATSGLLTADADEADRLLAVELAGAFRIRELEPRVAGFCRDAGSGRELRKAAIRALRELGVMSVETARAIFAATADDARLRVDAIGAWAESRDPATSAALVAAWEELSFAERQEAASRLARHREGARALLAALDAEDIDIAGLPVTVLVDIRAVLPQDPVLERIWSEVVAKTPNVLRLSGDDADAAATVSLAGPFTVEAWVNLESPIGVDDSLLAADNLIDMNFYEGRFRVWTKTHRDLVVATSRTTPDTWTHYAVTRDAAGTFRIFIDGELDAEGSARETIPYDGLRIGLSMRKGGTRGRMAEFRVWNVARTAAEIRSDFDRSYHGDSRRPPSLVSFHDGTSWGELAGDARVEPAPDAPALVTAAELAKRAEKFAAFRRLAAADGDAAKGRAVFAARCLTCHQQGGQGGRVGPALDGVGLTGVEAILRNVLTPNAAMEGGYRNFRIVTRDGRIVQGLLVSRDADAIVVRQPNTADVRIDSRDVEQAGFTGVSVMPEGLLESMPAADVSDLFAHLESLTTPPAR
jgi:putative heme-binding domain-containing protein